VPTLLLDGARWQTAEDFYEAFLRAVGAPSWHGHNFNALRDSIAVGDINSVSFPYDIIVHGTSRMTESALAIVRQFRELIEELRSAGTRVSIELQE
jgi:RNAse (barnase) inhibitor barstar